MQQKDIYEELLEQYMKVDKQLKGYEQKKKEFPNIYAIAIVELHAQQFFIAELLINHGKGYLIPKN